jgi:hypothetical protein
MNLSQGVYVLQDTSFQPLRTLSVPGGPGENAKAAQEVSVLPPAHMLSTDISCSISRCRSASSAAHWAPSACRLRSWLSPGSAAPAAAGRPAARSTSRRRLRRGTQHQARPRRPRACLAQQRRPSDRAGGEMAIPSDSLQRCTEED